MDLVSYTRKGNEHGGVLLGALQSFGEARAIPVVATMELTGKCSLACDMCYMRVLERNATLRERTTEEWISIGQQAKEMGTVHVSFSGGEPFLRPDFRDIYEAYIDMGFLVSILSNLTEVDEKTIEWLQKKKPLSIGMSLYGNSDETYERLCHRTGVYKKVIRALELLKEAKIDVLVKLLKTKQNEHDINGLIEFAKEHGFRYTVSDYLIDARDETQRKNTYIQNCSISGCDSNTEITNFLTGHFEEESEEKLFSQLRNASAQIVDGNRKSGFMCTAGRSRYWITWYGKMQACCELTQPSADPFEIGLRPAWDYIKNEIEKLSHPSECMACPYLAICGVCPARHFSETGSYNIVGRRVCLDTQKRFHAIAERMKRQ